MENDTKRCPFCGEEIKANAIKCKHCGEFLTSEGKKVGSDEGIKIFKKLGIGCLSIFVFIMLVGLFATITEDKNTVDTDSETSSYEAVEEPKETVPTDPIEFAKQLQAEIENNYPGNVNGMHFHEQYLLARQDILKAYSSKNCLLKLNNVCFKPIIDFDHKTEAMLYQDCLRNSYGIKHCHYAKDIWAGIVQKCGGVENLPTKEELRMLADYLYDIKAEDCTDFQSDDYTNCINKFKEGFPRKNDNDLVQEYFLYKHPFLPTSGEEHADQQRTNSFIIPSGEERDGYFVYGWWFGKNGTNYTADIYRSNSDMIGMCVSRD